jgi:hypothetical protein
MFPVFEWPHLSNSAWIFTCTSDLVVYSVAGIGSGVAMISMGMAAEEQKQQGAVLAHSPLEKKVRLLAQYL